MVEFADFLPQRQRALCAHGALNAEIAEFCFTVKLKSAPTVTSGHRPNQSDRSRFCHYAALQSFD
jgi:hypothetical protein